MVSPTMSQLEMGSINNSAISLEQCADFCINSTENGFNDWRIPTIREMKFVRFEMDLTGPWDTNFIWTSSQDFETGENYNTFRESDARIINRAPFELNYCKCIR